MTTRLEILNRVETVLQGTAGVDEIHWSRVSAISRAKFPTINIEPLNDPADRPSVSKLQWAMTFQVNVMVRDNDGYKNADSIVAEVHERIMGDATLDGMLVDLIPVGVQFSSFEADVPLHISQMQFRASYQTDYKEL